jgi:hypothetical protein
MKKLRGVITNVLRPNLRIVTSIVKLPPAVPLALLKKVSGLRVDQPVDEAYSLSNRVNWVCCNGHVPAHKDTNLMPWVLLLCVYNEGVAIESKGVKLTPTPGDLVALKSATVTHWTSGGDHKAVFLAYEDCDVDDDTAEAEFLKATEGVYACKF